MSWIAGVLAVFLFYKFVERNHKVIFLKISLLVLAVGGACAGAYLGYEQWAERTRQPEITVDYSYYNSNVPKEQKLKIANRLFEEFRSAGYAEAKNLTPDEESFVKNLFYPQTYFESKTLDQYTETQKEEDEAIYGSLIEEDQAKREKLEKKGNELATKRLNKYVDEFPTLRGQVSTEDQRVRYYYKLYARRESFFKNNELKLKLEKALLPSETEALERLEQIKSEQARKMRAALLAEDPSIEFIFTICNKRDIPLQSYSFYVSGLEYGRSTPHAIFKDAGTNTRLEGDIIVKPKSCTSPSWKNNFVLYDKYVVSAVNGVWDGPK